MSNMIVVYTLMREVNALKDRVAKLEEGAGVAPSRDQSEDREPLPRVYVALFANKDGSTERRIKDRWTGKTWVHKFDLHARHVQVPFVLSPATSALDAEYLVSCAAADLATPAFWMD